MDSVIMTSPGNSSRLRSRLRSAANAICARSSKLSKSNNHLHRNNSSVNKNSNQIRHTNLSRNNSIHRSNSMHNKHLNNNKNLDKNANQQSQDKLLSTQQGNNDLSVLLAGKFAREVYSFWCSRLGPSTNRIPVDSIQALFNDMHLYPSKAQVYEMIQCARVCGTRTGGGVVSNLITQNPTTPQQFLTFGEFCVFAGELRRHATSTYLQKNHQNNQNENNDRQKITNNANVNNRVQTKYEVFLGGSCNPTTWRADIAIPTLNSWGISFYNPQVSTWSPELIQTEHHAKESADVLFFVLDSETRCLAGMVEVAQLHAAQRCLVVVAFSYKPRQLICNEEISPQEYLDLWYGQNTLLALLRQDETPVFTNIKSALQCTARILRESSNSNEDYTEELHLTDKLNKLRDAFNSADRTKSGNLSLTEVCDAYHMVTRNILSISDLKLIVRNYYHNNNSTPTAIPTDLNDMRITFEQFCGIVTEFTTQTSISSSTMLHCNGIENLDHHRGANNTFSSNIYINWKIAFITTQQLLRIYVVKPLANIIEWASNQPLPRQFSSNTNYETIDNNGCISTSMNYPHNTIRNALEVSEIHLDNVAYRDIYLGGSYSSRNHTWRENIAIPLINQYGLTYYTSNLCEITDPLSHISSEDMCDESVDTMLENIKNNTNIASDMKMELKLLQNSRVLLFVIPANSRSIASMLLAAYCVGLNKYDIVLCVQKLSEDNCKLGCEELTKYAIKDYNRSRAYLSDMAKREGIPVFECINEAVQCAIEHNLQRYLLSHFTVMKCVSGFIFSTSNKAVMALLRSIYMPYSPLEQYNILKNSRCQVTTKYTRQQDII